MTWFIAYLWIICSLFQLFGRAGRNGHPALTVLFFSESAEKKCSDATLKAICHGKENCRRTTLLEGLGSSEHPKFGLFQIH